MRDALPDLTAAGVAVVGISPDPVAQQKKFDDKHGLGFALLSDSDHHIADAYGVWGEKKMYGRSYEGIIRSHFVIDAEGLLQDVQYKVSPQKSIERALKQMA